LPWSPDRTATGIEHHSPWTWPSGAGGHRGQVTWWITCMEEEVGTVAGKLIGDFN
jgi:hypothetical protein